MAKSRSIEAMLDRLAALKGQPDSPEARKQLAEALASKVSFVVAKAARLISQLRLADLYPQLEQAFERFRAAGDSDKGCEAKTEIARAAIELQCPAERLLLEGIHHVQMEGSFGEPVDVAAELRGLCALGLVQLRYRGVMNELVELLVDPEPQARIGAVRALANTGREDAALLLRLKTLSGDRDPDVLFECFTALVQLAPADSVPFVARFLESGEAAIREGAALALGASRQPAALELLQRQYAPRVDPSFRPTLLLAIATVRLPEALEFLLELVQTGPIPGALDAIAALALYRHDSALCQRIAGIIEERNAPPLRQQFAAKFGGQ